MAVDKNKVIAEATKFAQRGQWDKAIRAYEKILSDDAKDVRVLLKVGELHQKRGDDGAAAVTFARVAEAYTEQGFFLKAIAVYKQMLKLAPDDVRVNEKLASLYQQLGIMSDAMGQLQVVAAAAEKANDQAKLVDVLQRMTAIEPENVASAVKLGEMHARSGRTAEAMGEFRRAADVLKRNNRADEWLRVAERMAFLAPEDLQLTRELANVYLAKGDTKRALAKLQLCFKADPKDIETLNLLATAFRALGQASKQISVFKELAHVYGERGRGDEARATWRRVAELAPADPDALAALGSPSPAGPAAARRAPAAGPPPGARVGPGAPMPPAAPRPPARPAGPEAIPKLLTETDVYVKYGLHQKAIEHLRRVFEIDPDHLEAREKAREIRAAAGDAAGAAEEAARAARLAVSRGPAERARAAVERLAALAPNHPDIAALASRAGVAAPVRPVEEEVVVEVETHDSIAVAPAALGPGGGQADEADAVALAGAEGAGDEVVDDDLPSAGPDASAPARGDLPPPPGPPSRAAAPEAAPQPPPSGPPALPTGGRAAMPSLEDEEDVDLSDELGEAEFFVQQGLFEDAREALRNLLRFHPGHSGAVALLAEVEERAALRAATRSLAAAAPPPAMDIGHELAEELGASAPPAEEFQYSVEEVFSQFKKGVAETVKAEDCNTHYDLGIAYKEMGLVDDALAEFETALRGAGRGKEVECLSMIGLCRLERGDAAGAADAWRRALRTDRLAPEAARALHYDLARAHQALGDPEAALWYLHKVLKADPKFRDAAAVVRRLGGGPGRPPAAAVPPPTGDGPSRGGNKNVGYV